MPACYRYLLHLSVITYNQSLHPEVDVINISEQDVDNINNFYCRLDQTHRDSSSFSRSGALVHVPQLSR